MQRTDFAGWKAFAEERVLSGADDLAASGKGCESQTENGKILSDGGQVENRIIEGLGIEEDWLNRYPQELSGGELQRFCIARALGKETRFLIADEISTMLDLITQSQIWNFLLDEVKRREIGLIVVSHSEALLKQVAERKLPFTAEKTTA